MESAITLAFYNMATNIGVKSFIVVAPRLFRLILILTLAFSVGYLVLIALISNSPITNSVTTLSITTLSMTTFSIMILSMRTCSITTKNETPSIIALYTGVSC
jgi:hypothetical protein